MVDVEELAARSIFTPIGPGVGLIQDFRHVVGAGINIDVTRLGS